MRQTSFLQRGFSQRSMESLISTPLNRTFSAIISKPDRVYFYWHAGVAHRVTGRVAGHSHGWTRVGDELRKWAGSLASQVVQRGATRENGAQVVGVVFGHQSFRDALEGDARAPARSVERAPKHGVDHRIGRRLVGKAVFDFAVAPQPRKGGPVGGRDLLSVRVVCKMLIK